MSILRHGPSMMPNDSGFVLLLFWGRGRGRGLIYCHRSYSCHWENFLVNLPLLGYYSPHFPIQNMLPKDGINMQFDSFCASYKSIFLERDDFIRLLLLFPFVTY